MPKALKATDEWHDRVSGAVRVAAELKTIAGEEEGLRCLLDAEAGLLAQVGAHALVHPRPPSSRSPRAQAVEARRADRLAPQPHAKA